MLKKKDELSRANEVLDRLHDIVESERKEAFGRSEVAKGKILEGLADEQILRVRDKMRSEGGEVEVEEKKVSVLTENLGLIIFLLLIVILAVYRVARYE